MAYSQVKTPRFYTNDLTFAHAIRELSGNTQFAHGNPSSIYKADIPKEDSKTFSINRYNVPHAARPNYFALLGHNLAETNRNIKMKYMYNNNTEGDVITELVNGRLSSNIGWHADHQSNWLSPDYNGFSICSIDEDNSGGNYNELDLVFWNNNATTVRTLRVGTIFTGRYYDMKNAPNLSLTMSREYGEIKEFTTYNGSSMSNAMNIGASKWGYLGAWELWDPGVTKFNQNLSRSGRRVWQLKFSFMDDGDLWGSNQSISNFPNADDPHYTPIFTGSGETDGADPFQGYEASDLRIELPENNSYGFQYNLLTDDNFFSQVWHKTLGGTLPFIFQPDGGDTGNFNPDQFAICKIKDKSLKATQTAFNVYDISMTIEEVW